MSPRRGGESDKIGNRYEGAWTTCQLLHVLDGQLDWVRVEPIGDLGTGVEFLLRRRDGGQEVHQVKRQHGTDNEWSVMVLRRLRVWSAAQIHVENGRAYHFVSMVPFRALQELADRARNSNDYASFVRDRLSRELGDLFTELTGIYGNPHVVWDVLRGFHYHVADETELRRTNTALAEMTLEGAEGASACSSIGDVIDDNFDVELNSNRLLRELEPYGLRRRLVADRPGMAERIEGQTSAWLSRVRQRLIEPTIRRRETEVLRRIPQEADRVHFLLAAAGGGKTAILVQAVSQLLEDHVPTLVVQLDRYGELSSTSELGRLLDLPVSPVAALALAADGRPAVLVIDQLDAVSLLSGRLPQNFEVVADLIASAAGFANVHIVFGCRHFDVQNDERIRRLRGRLEPHDVSVGPLTDEQVNDAVAALQLPADTLTARQRDILRLPLHLLLLKDVAGQPRVLDFNSSQWLFDAYWEHKQQAVQERRAGTRFHQVVSRLTDVMSDRQLLQVPRSVLDADDLSRHADVLVSEQLLVRDGPRIGFFHEALFDFAFARQWSDRGQSLVGFLIAGEQELFRRAQVRQIMTHLRATDTARFLDEVRSLLDDDAIRFHIKDVALTVLGSLSDPSSDEASLLLEVAANNPEFQDRVWARLRTPAWFERFDSDGFFVRWLDGNEVLQNRALNLMAGAAGSFPDRMAELLAAYRDHPSFSGWLRWVMRFADVRSSRPLFERLLDGVRTGAYAAAVDDLSLATHNLAEAEPEWAVELLAQFLSSHPHGSNRDALGRLEILENREHGLIELTKQAAERAPQLFVDLLLPYVLRVMAATSREIDSQRPLSNVQFSRQMPGMITMGDLGDTLFEGMAVAIRALVIADVAGARPTLQLLADDPHESAQWLLYRGLLAGLPGYAEWAAQLLLEGRHRLLCAYGSNSVWVTRQLLQGISPLISDELFSDLESLIRDLRFRWETPGPAFYGFTLLSALSEARLSDVGQKRLAELRRAAGAQQPPEPAGMIGGFVGPPIPPGNAARMTDKNWLKAMVRYADERRRDLRALTGGARSLSPVLKAQVVAQPERFARLATRFTADLNPAYYGAVLMGLGEAVPLDDPSSIFDAVRHIATFENAQADRWLGYSLRHYYKVVPNDLVQLLVERVQSSADPIGDRPSFERPDGRRRGDLRIEGMNSTRGSLAEVLGDLLIFDVDGSRAAVVAPILRCLASDPVLSVRAAVAHTLAAALRHARPEAVEAFDLLIDCNDLLLAEQPVVQLMIYLGNADSAAIRPTVERMLLSSEVDVREAGGELAAFAAMQWDMQDMLQTVLAGADSAARKGAASVCAHRLPHTASSAVAAEALLAFMGDSSGDVREAAASTASALRGQALRPFEGILKALMLSPAFVRALPQLLITLEDAPDRVDDLALLCAQRFVAVSGAEAGDLRTRAAGDARQVGQLIIRGLTQSRSAAERAALLDVLDGLLVAGAYGIEDLIGASERPR